MLALVTCHIFPLPIWYGKKWIPGTWLPGWQLAVFQSPRLHECGPADAHGNAQPFCMDKCIFRKKHLICNLATRWNKNSSICPIISYLWMVDLVMRLFFLWGQPLKIIHKNSAKKRPTPLDFIFDTCASASSSHLFLVGEAEHMWLYPFARVNAFSAKNICFVIWARVDTKFLNSSHHVLSVDDWPGDATFFLWAKPLKITRKYSVKKRSSPLDFIFDTCASASSSHFFGWWSWTCVFVPFCKDNCIFSKTTCVLQFGRALTQNSWIRPIMSYQWMIGLVMRLFSCGANLWRSSASIQSKKVQPLGFYFWPLRLGLLKSLFWLVKVNISVYTLLQNYVKNHTPSINHGTFFPGVWHLDMF